jgi:hypothetical protein
MRRSSALAAAVLVLVVTAVLLCTGPLTRGASAAPAVRLPPADGLLDYQLGGAYPPAADVAIVDRDRTDPPVAGRYNVCYINAFQTQPGASRAFARTHPGLVLRVSGGRPLVDPGWPDEYLFDVSTARRRARLAAIVGRWIDGCARSGHQAVEADNLDSWTRSRGQLSRRDALAFATLLVRRAHARGLAIGQKNGADLATVGRRVVGFDFAVAEECQVYRECGAYTRAYGDQVYEIEYSDNGRRAYPAACAAQGRSISVTYRDRDVVPRGAEGYVSAHC